MLAEVVSFRPMVPSDEPFILSSWLKSYRASRYVHGIPGEVYYAGQHALVRELLFGSDVYVAVNRADPTQILGYVVLERRVGLVVLHYVYVKSVFRRHGLAERLLSELVGPYPIHHTHQTDAALPLLKKWNSVFNPYLTRHP